MPDIPEENYSPDWADADRVEIPRLAGEKQTAAAYLDWARQTLAAKCAQLSADQLSQRAVPPSTMSLHGLVRHLAGVERWWFRIQFAGEEVPLLYYSDDDPEQDFETLDGDPFEAIAQWRAECEASRAIVAAEASLDATGTAQRGGEFSLRWLMWRMVDEYARHNGHADLLREAIDGRTGR